MVTAAISYNNSSNYLDSTALISKQLNHCYMEHLQTLIYILRRYKMFSLCLYSDGTRTLFLIVLFFLQKKYSLKKNYRLKKKKNFELHHNRYARGAVFTSSSGWNCQQGGRVVGVGCRTSNRGGAGSNCSRRQEGSPCNTLTSGTYGVSQPIFCYRDNFLLVNNQQGIFF